MHTSSRVLQTELSERVFRLTEWIQNEERPAVLPYMVSNDIEKTVESIIDISTTREVTARHTRMTFRQVKCFAAWPVISTIGEAVRGHVMPTWALYTAPAEQGR